MRKNSERVSSPWSVTPWRTAVRASAMRAGDLVDRVARHHDLDHRVVVFHHRLTAETRGRREAGRFVQHVLLVLLRLGEVVESFLHDEVTGRARAAPSAGMLERHAVGEQDVQQRPGPAVVLERRFAEVDLDDAIGVAVLEVDDDLGHEPCRCSRHHAARRTRGTPTLAGRRRRGVRAVPPWRFTTTRTATSSPSPSTGPRRATRSTSSTSGRSPTAGYVSATTTTRSSPS